MVKVVPINLSLKCPVQLLHDTSITSHSIAVVPNSETRGLDSWLTLINEPPRDKTNNTAERPAKTDQPGHPSSLISLRCALNG